MVFQLDPTLDASLHPLAWLAGTWAGVGVVDHPTVPQARFAQEVEFTHDRRDFLEYTSRQWLLGDDGERVRPLAVEKGFWRTAGPVAEGKGTELEVVLVHPAGYVEVYVGQVTGPRIQLATDLVARTATAHEHTASARMYGLVEGDLLWALDVAAGGHPLSSHSSARLTRMA